MTSVSHQIMSNCLGPHGLQPTRLLCPWNIPGEHTGMDCHFLLQGIFLSKGSNSGFPRCRQTLYRLSHQVSPQKTLCCAVLSYSVMSDSVTPWTAVHQAPLSMGFSRHEYWNGLPFPSPGDLPNTGIKPGTPAQPLFPKLESLSRESAFFPRYTSHPSK